MGLEGWRMSEATVSAGHFSDMAVELILPPSTQTPEFGTSASGCAELQLLLQAQFLLKKSELYQKIDSALHQSTYFQPNLSNLLQADGDDDQITTFHRNAAVTNLKFLNMFYGYSPASFFLAVNLLDRLLGKVITRPRYLSCIATSCFYIAIKTQEADVVFIPSAKELVTISQCGCSVAELLRMEGLILEKLQWVVQAVTPFTFLQQFYDVLANRSSALANDRTRATLIAKLQVLACQIDFCRYKAETVALALLGYTLQEMDLLVDAELFMAIVELQYYCQISDWEFLQCRGLIMDYLVLYYSQPNKRPHLELVWTVSRRTLNKLKPSTRVELDLEPIEEDEGDSDDAGPFDSENEHDLERTLTRSGFESLCTGNTGSDAVFFKSQPQLEVRPLQDKCPNVSFVPRHSTSKM